MREREKFVIMVVCGIFLERERVGVVVDVVGERGRSGGCIGDREYDLCIQIQKFSPIISWFLKRPASYLILH